MASSQVSAPVTHGFVDTQRMQSPGSTNVSRLDESRDLSRYAIGLLITGIASTVSAAR